jgi:hypothetical protein
MSRVHQGATGCRHAIQVSLPGYQTFETELTLMPDQKVTLESDLMKAR